MNIVNKKRKSLHFATVPSVFALVIASILIFVLLAHLEPDYTEFFFESCFEQPLLLLFNLGPILLLAFTLYGLSGHAPFSIIVTAALFLTGGAVNHYKILFRNEPFVYADLGLIREGIGILRTFDTTLFAVMILVIIGICLLLAVSLYFIAANKKHRVARYLVSVLCIVTFVLLYRGPLTSWPINEKMPMQGYIYNIVECYCSRGWTYEFIHNSRAQKLTKPPKYSASEFADSNDAVDPGDFENNVKPHVIMIMAEAFSDFSENEHFSFTDYRDPLTNYKAIAAEAVVSGHAGVDTFGGGTARTEFEALTAIDTTAIDITTNPYNIIRQPLDSLPKAFNDLGYDTIALHPGYGWFYNRQNVYPRLGFDDFICIDHGFTGDEESKGNYISETATFAKLRETLSPYLSGEKATPSFTFCVTIENHGGYKGKYGAIEDNFTSDISYSDGQRDLIANYFHGVNDGDIELGAFIDELREAETPVVVIYWGDHYPGLEDVYKKTGYGFTCVENDRATINGFFTPFFIWQNDAAATLTPITANAEKYGLAHEHNVFDSTYLGSTVLQLMAMDEISPFLANANALRSLLPVHNIYGYIDSKGNFSEEVPAGAAEAEARYNRWCYDLMTKK